MATFSSDGKGVEPCSNENRGTNKVRFKDDMVVMTMDIAVDSPTKVMLSWKDRLMGKGIFRSRKSINPNGLEDNDDFELLEGDVTRSIVNKIPSIQFSNRVHQLLIKDMDTMMRPSMPFQLMDTENGYFLEKFQNKKDYEKVLSQGPWVIYMQYLTVQLWTIDFRPSQPYLSIVMAWIHFSSLLGYMYKRKIVEEIGNMVGKVVKLDYNIDNRTRGHFARMAVYVNLDKPPISQVLINGINQLIEYELLPMVYFSYRRYGHLKELCPRAPIVSNQQGNEVFSNDKSSTKPGMAEKKEAYEVWMLAERKSWRKS
ncbi:hypothetical protein Goshw_008593 [Gossypium schwendimanii]|uniref:DUF4283 domain-containing protein n=1 Tax=Gossypium schwendimanii TaxID=34291 RepID=A0A7J9KRE3_GOSSC|nr:hypothetical protein [Gossypium schwendimanii]